MRAQLKGLLPKWRISNFLRFGDEHTRALSIPSSMVYIIFFVENDVNTIFRNLWKFVLFPKWCMSQLCLFPKVLISSWPIGTHYAITWPPNVSWRLSCFVLLNHSKVMLWWNWMPRVCSSALVGPVRTGTAYVYKISFASPYREKYLLRYAVMSVRARISYSYLHF